MDMMLWVWLGVMVLAVIIELATQELISIWFAVGGLVSMLLSLIPKFSWPWQVLVFVVISITLIVSLRKICKDLLNKKSDGKTNLSLVIGKKVKLISNYDEDNLGTAKLGDVVWNVKEINGEQLEKGEHAEIVKVSGNKLIVKKIKGDND